MKNAAITLMSIGLFVFIKNSRAEDHGKVFTKLATGKDNAGQPVIPEGRLPVYLDQHGWTSIRGGLTRQQAEAAIAGDAKVITKGKWDTILQTGAWLAEHDPGKLWQLYSWNRKIPKEQLAEYMRNQRFSGGMTAEQTVTAIADADGKISWVMWNAMIETAKCVRDAK